MANCPSCGSSHITLRKETNVSWGRAVAGWALFGVVGGAVGAVTGEDRNVNACLDCGTSWKAADLYKTIQIIKNSTGNVLDLTRESDRIYMNSFISEVSPYLEAIQKAEKKGENLVAEIQKKSTSSTETGCGWGCGITVIGLFSLASALSFGGIVLLILVPPLVGLFLGASMDNAKKKTVDVEIEKTRKEANKMKLDAEENFKYIVREFMNKRPFRL